MLDEPVEATRKLAKHVHATHVKDVRAVKLPLLVLTSEFGTLSMWDWELIAYLKSEGVGSRSIAPHNIEHTRTVLRALAVKRQLSVSKLVVYQDNPGNGMQAPIFKRFYWWESEWGVIESGNSAWRRPVAHAEAA